MSMARLLDSPLIALPLRNANFGLFRRQRRFLVGMWMQRIAIGWLTWQLTESGFWLGIIAFADFFPVLLVGPIAGAAADRWDRLRGGEDQPDDLRCCRPSRCSRSPSAVISTSGFWSRSPPSRASWSRSTSRRGSRWCRRWCPSGPRVGGGHQFGRVQSRALHRPDAGRAWRSCGRAWPRRSRPMRMSYVAFLLALARIRIAPTDAPHRRGSEASPPICRKASATRRRIRASPRCWCC